MPKIFSEKVFGAVSRIPKGKLATYKQIAIKIGHPNSSRAVGNALHKNPNAPFVPCHRVIRSNGDLGGYAKGAKEKMKILKQEGIMIKNGKIVDFNFYLIKK